MNNQSDPHGVRGSWFQGSLLFLAIVPPIVGFWAFLPRPTFMRSSHSLVEIGFPP
ncbi:hypothetical protein [Altericista sp. CCNU0014]|uniref:hypothetical protein n=1 Tax=Altericista sp. CCNU0014 TaxID=3082949 RepID=UPI00384CC274